MIKKKVNQNNARHQTKLSLRGHSVSWLLTQALGDWLVSGQAESAWQAPEKRSRARSQFLWVLVLASEASSTDTAAPEPRPDWALRTCSWICDAHTKGSERKSHALAYMTLRKQTGRNYVTGSFIPAPSLPSPSPRFQPIFSSICLPLFSSPISLYKNKQWEKAQVCENIFHFVMQERYCSTDQFTGVNVWPNRLRTHEQKQEHRLSGTFPRFRLSAGGFLLYPYTCCSSGPSAPHNHCSETHTQVFV